jgi:uncharacterized protein with PIN domain
MARRAVLRLYAELNDDLPPERRQRDLEIRLEPDWDVRALLRELWIPSGAVELALVNGSSRPLNHRLAEGDRISLYPTFESFDLSQTAQLRDRPLRRVAFVADAHLGRLARYLRLLGFDTLFENDPGDRELARISIEEHRILLTRDRALLQRRGLTHALWVPALRPRDQLAFVLARLDLFRLLRPFTRCTVCNGALVAVDKAAVTGEVPPRVQALFDAFWRCTECGRIYWQGSHYERLHRLVEQIAAGDHDPVAPAGGADQREPE